MPETMLDGQKVHYLDQGSGEPLLLLPDSLHAAAAYTSEVEYFSSRFRVISLDHLGTGLLSETRGMLLTNEQWAFGSFGRTLRCIC